MKIQAPVAAGSGAQLVYESLAAYLPDYHVCAYNPWRTAFPPLLYPVCRSGRPDLVHTTPDYAYFKRRRGIPLVLTFHGYALDRGFRQHCSPLQRLHYATDLRFFTRLAVNRANVITAVSRYTAGLVTNDLQLPEAVRVIYNGIDEQRFVPSGRHAAANDKLRVLFSGNLKASKGADLLPAIADRLGPGIELHYTSGLRSRERLPDHPALRPVGRVDHGQMPELYNSADILLFPTMREGFGLAAAEAMACGLPVVATDCSALPELVTHGKGGLLCPPGDAGAFAAAINQLADSPITRQQMGEYNRARIEHEFTLDRMVNAYRALFEEILDSSR